jgi:hypothetical protein
MNVDTVMNDLVKRHPGEVEYHQAVREVLESIEEVYNENPHFRSANIVDRIIEPDRVMVFKVPWADDQGSVHVNLGYRVHFCYESRIYHIGGGTLPENDHKKTYLNFRNNIILLYKNLPAHRMARVLLPRIILDHISLFQFLARFEFRNFAAVVKAHAVLLRNLSTLKKIRQKNLEICKPALHPEILNSSIVYNFFLRRRKHFRDLDFNKKPHRRARGK